MHLVNKEKNEKNVVTTHVIKYGQKKNLAKNNGKTMVLRKVGKYVTNGEELVEGSLPTEDEPMKIYEYRVDLKDHGGYITYSDQVDIYALNSGWATRLQKNQGHAVGELFENKIKNIFPTKLGGLFHSMTEIYID